MIQQRRRYLAAAALACMIVAGCGQRAAEGNKATGEVLKGTINDAMIATDEVRTEPPLAPQSAKAANATGDKAKGKTQRDASEAAPVVDASPAVDAAPAPKPSASEPAG